MRRLPAPESTLVANLSLAGVSVMLDQNFRWDLSSMTGCFIIKIWCWCCWAGLVQEGNISLTCKKYLHVTLQEAADMRREIRQTTGYQVLCTKYYKVTSPHLHRKLCGIFGSSGHDFAIIISRARGALDWVQLPIINQLSSTSHASRRCQLYSQ